MDQIKLQQNENFLNELIAYHVVTGELYPSDIPMEGSLISYYGRVIEVNQLDDQIYFNGIRTTLDEGCIRVIIFYIFLLLIYIFQVEWCSSHS